MTTYTVHATYNTYQEAKISNAEVEWKNGDECLYMNSSELHKFIGIDPTRNDFCYIKANCAAVNWVEISKLSKPETPQQRKDRERLENGKSLHNAASKTEEAISHGIFRLWEMEDKEVRRHYCQLAEIIGYRKEKSYGTN